MFLKLKRHSWDWHNSDPTSVFYKSDCKIRRLQCQMFKHDLDHRQINHPFTRFP
jgi:hypothetical protein